MSTPHTIYVARDDHGGVLYVGRTVDFGRRRREHATNSHWYSEARRWHFLYADDNAAAHRLETHLIRTFRPRHNLLLNPAHQTATVTHGPMPETVRDRKEAALRRLRAERGAA